MRHDYFLNLTCDMVENKQQRRETLPFSIIDMQHLTPPLPPIKGSIYVLLLSDTWSSCHISFKMRGRADKPLLILLVFIWAFPVQPANAQDYTWEGAITAGVSETFYRFGPQYDMIVEPEDDDSTAKMPLPAVFPFFGTDQTMVSVSRTFCLMGSLKNYFVLRIDNSRQGRLSSGHAYP